MVRGLGLLAVVTIFIGANSSARTLSAKSAVRAPGTSYLTYRSVATIFAQPPQTQNSGKAAVDSTFPYTEDGFPEVTEWESVAAMNSRFEKIRDTRWLTTSDHPGFLRRSSWLYPDDGCFARAGLAVMNLVKLKAALPNKIFVFGDLTVKTPNASGGEVGWWYHVAPIVQVSGQKYVLDPAISPRAPIKLEEWLARMNPDIHHLEIAICKSGSYSPDDLCDHVTDGVESTANDDQQEFLINEWSRLEELQRNPIAELGDSPPWLSPLATAAGL